MLLNTQGQIKIADFGVSGKINNTNSSKGTWIGTVTYMSPERLEGLNYTSDSDLWSLGITILECLIG